jgi:inner membrane transporter RhtA
VAIGAVAATPFGIGAALPAVAHATWLLWGLGVGICSTVIPYLTDQLAMVRLPRATYSLMLALLPVTATACGIALLHQLPGRQDLAGLALVVAGVAAHRAQDTTKQGDPRDGVLDPRRQRPRRVAARARDDELRQRQQAGLAPRP